jgi:hypothetical protein
MRLHELLVVAVGLVFFGGSATLASRGRPTPPPAGDTGDTGAADTGPADTGNPGGDDTGSPGGDDASGADDGAAGTDTGPAERRRSAAQVAGEKGGFSCAVAPGASVGAWALALGAVGLARRRRAGRG